MAANIPKWISELPKWVAAVRDGIEIYKVVRQTMEERHTMEHQKHLTLEDAATMLTKEIQKSAKIETYGEGPADSAAKTYNRWQTKMARYGKKA